MRYIFTGAVLLLISILLVALHFTGLDVWSDNFWQNVLAGLLPNVFMIIPTVFILEKILQVEKNSKYKIINREVNKDLRLTIFLYLYYLVQFLQLGQWSNFNIKRETHSNYLKSDGDKLVKEFRRALKSGAFKTAFIKNATETNRQAPFTDCTHRVVGSFDFSNIEPLPDPLLPNTFDDIQNIVQDIRNSINPTATVGQVTNDVDKLCRAMNDLMSVYTKTKKESIFIDP